MAQIPHAASLRSAATKIDSHEGTKTQRKKPLKLRDSVALCESQLFLLQGLTVDPRFAQEDGILTSGSTNERGNADRRMPDRGWG